MKWTGQRPRWMVALFAGLVLLLVASAYRFCRTIRSAVADLYSDASSHPGDVDLETVALPDPVRRYFDTVLEDHQPVPESVYLQQRGEIRLGGGDSGWRPFRATQHVSLDPPGFVWDAHVGIVSVLRARVLDSYVQGEGRLRAKLGSVFPVANAGPSSEMNEGELLRYLAEAVWYPSALLPSRGVEWEPVTESASRATLRDGEVTASIVFHFDERGLVDRATGMRYRQETDSYEQWIGHFSDYGRRNGRLIPTQVEVAWDLPAGETPYFRATIEDVDHRAEHRNR